MRWIYALIRCIYVAGITLVLVDIGGISGYRAKYIIIISFRFIWGRLRWYPLGEYWRLVGFSIQWFAIWLVQFLLHAALSGNNALLMLLNGWLCWSLQSSSAWGSLIGLNDFCFWLSSSSVCVKVCSVYTEKGSSNFCFGVALYLLSNAFLWMQLPS